MTEPSPEHIARPRIVGRYALFDEIAAGGMATVHLGRLVGQVGFSRTVAVKRLHPQYAKDQEFVSMFVDEARLASRIQHPNVVSTLDVVKTRDELFVVMEYVQGEALSKLVRNAAKRGERIPPNIVTSVMSGMLHGLHAAHEAKSETREPLNLVHRDISPQNVHVGVDGVARVLDFGVAKAAMRSGATRDGQMKGKLSYMSPEQLNGKEIDRRSDIFAAGVVLWEALAGKRLFAGADAGEILGKVLATEIPTPKSVVPTLGDELNAVVMQALERDPEARFQTAREFAVALEQTGPLATAHTVGEWVKDFGGEELASRGNLVHDVESYPMDELEDRPSGVEELTYRDGGRVSVVHDPSPPAPSDRRPRARVGRRWAVGFLLIGMIGGGLAVRFLVDSNPDPQNSKQPGIASVELRPVTELPGPSGGNPSAVGADTPKPAAEAQGATAEHGTGASGIGAGAVGAGAVGAGAVGAGAVAPGSSAAGPNAAGPNAESRTGEPAGEVAGDTERGTEGAAGTPAPPGSAEAARFGGRNPRQPVAPSPRARDCNPPYTIDANTGIRKPKLQCLKP